MPPTAATRRTQNQADQSRRSSGRQIRTSISRPTNYYARPFGSVGGAEEVQDDSPPGFFPAIQYFSDAAAALPKEAIRHFTLMKEVEAKVYGPTQEMVQGADRIHGLPTPPRRSHQPSHQALLTFTANNSSGANSANVSMINGSVPGMLPPSVVEAVEQLSQPTQAEQIADMQRRQEFHNFRMTIGQILANLDEKNVCLTEANRTLDRQLDRSDTVMPHVESEISEEARLGSLTHWAYADNRKKNAAPQAPERARRDVAATSSLAAAAAAIHEGDIAAARNEGREKTKKSKAQQVDSEFEERGPPKKSHHKAKKVAENAADGKAGQTAAANSQPPKKRRVDKTGGVAMERTASAAKGGKAAAAAASRSTPAVETVKKKSKPPVPPLSKKKLANAGSPAHSPRTAASPTMASFALGGEVNGQRPGSRMRQGSSTLAQSTSINKTSPPADKKPNGDTKSNGINRSEAMDGVETSADTKATHHAESKRPSSSNAHPTSAETSNSSHLHDPKPEPTDMVRTRSNGVRTTTETATSGQIPSGTQPGKTSARSSDAGGKDGGSANNNGGSNASGGTARSSAHGHSHGHRSGSSQHILKQIASFNRSPTMGRRELPSASAGTTEGSSTGDDEVGSSRPRRSGALRSGGSVAGGEDRGGGRTGSRLRDGDGEGRLDDDDRRDEEEGEERREGTRGRGRERERSERGRARDREAEREEGGDGDGDDEVDGDGEADGEGEEVEGVDDPDEPRYCYCGRGSYGTMIGCENDDCPREWFHIQCVGLSKPPGENVKWYCDDCDPHKRKKSKSGRH